jgi:hypothetical protein
MDIPPPDPTKMLEHWMAWERGERPPGKTLGDLKTAGLRQLLEQAAELAASNPAP